MGEMTLLITGASGMLGRAAVAEARSAGHRVIALVRSKDRAPQIWATDKGITVLGGDLCAPDDATRAALASADCTLHCAASVSGDAAAHARDTLCATEALLEALPQGAKLVHISTIAVYDYTAMAPGTLVNEQSPLEQMPARRDAYAAAKLAQEALVRARSDLELTILRPGAIWGAGQLWNAHLGRMLGPILLRFGGRGQVPLIHLSLAARAAIAACARPAMDPVNLVDDDLPDRLRFLNALEQGPKLILPLPAALLAPVMSEATRAARYRPFGFDPTRMQTMLGIRQDKGFERLMHEAQA